MSIATLISRARNRSLDRSASMDKAANRLFSGTNYALWRASKDQTADVSHGLTLDAGSGRGGWASVIERHGVRESVDIEAKPGETVTWIADLIDMPAVPGERYDGAVCHQVLEHVNSPAKAVAELYRVLKPGGRLMLSVPHLSRQHELPHDFFRFTPQGVELLLREAGFDQIEIHHFGGILCFVHHQIATIAIGLADYVPGLGVLARYANMPFSVLCEWIDRVTDRRGLLATGVVAVATKPATSAEQPK